MLVTYVNSWLNRRSLKGSAGNCCQPPLGGSSLPFSPLMRLSQNLYVGYLCELLAQPQEQRRGQGTAANFCLAAVPCPSLRGCGWAESSLTQNRKIEIPNNTDPRYKNVYNFETRPRSFISGNICFKFSVLCGRHLGTPLNSEHHPHMDTSERSKTPLSLVGSLKMIFWMECRYDLTACSQFIHKGIVYEYFDELPNGKWTQYVKSMPLHFSLISL